MGWFDNEQQEGKPNTAPVTPAGPPARPVVHNNPGPPDSGSTLGREIHIDGTIVCQEDLTIIGRVDGTIRAKGTLVIAKDADVHAKIDGQRVMVQGKVDGNVQGAERVTLGGTARLIGNIETPILEIVEGAVFRGTVEMKQSKPEQSKPEPAKRASPPPVAKPPGGSDGKPPAAGPSSTPNAAEAPKPAQKQAMS